MVGASRRGRSHAHTGTYRDDDFTLRAASNGWFIITVADGAGSAKYSRRGSEIMCSVTTERVQLLADEHLAGDFEVNVKSYRSDPSHENEREIRSGLYAALGSAAFEGYKAIEAEARQKSAESKDYATTLVLTICKRYSFGWFVGCLAIGDGGAALLLSPEQGGARVLNTPEGGEFSGQTRFVTMPEVWRDSAELFNSRIKFSIVPDFVALLAMTDGVSDPYFGTDSQFMDPERWLEFWGLLGESVRIRKDNPRVHRELLEWLEFWVDGEHDDRTIALLLP